jgi:hypothetical protein
MWCGEPPKLRLGNLVKATQKGALSGGRGPLYVIQLGPEALED